MERKLMPLDEVYVHGCSVPLTIISVERGVVPELYYCVDDNGNGDWFTEKEILKHEKEKQVAPRN